MKCLLKNNASALLATSIGTSDTSLSVASGKGALYPDPTGDEWFPLTVVSAGGDREIMRATARTGDVITVERHQEGTTAKAFTAGAIVQLRPTAAALSEDLIEAENDLQAEETARDAADDALQAQIDERGARTGDVFLTFDDTAPTGWLMVNDQTIGNTSSVATYANALAHDLYVKLWAKVSNTYAPVTGGRGANAEADWTAQKPIALTKMLGRALAIAGAGATLTARTLGQTLGAETHQLVQGELPNVTLSTAIASGQGVHAHAPVAGRFISDVGGGGSIAANGGGPSWNIQDITATATLPAMTGTTPLGGSGTAHNNMQPSTFLNARIKL